MDDGQRASDQAGGDSVGAACGPPLFCVSEKKGEKHPETLQKEKKPLELLQSILRAMQDILKD